MYCLMSCAPPSCMPKRQRRNEHTGENNSVLNLIYCLQPEDSFGSVQDLPVMNTSHCCSHSEPFRVDEEV